MQRRAHSNSQFAHGRPSECICTGFTEGLHGFTRQWTELPLSFDAIYTGYMSSPEQVEACAELTDVLRKPGTLFVADPALGDNGSLYSGVNKATASAMARFCCRADLILPNLTEAALLLGEKPNLSPTRAEVEELLQKLAALGPRASQLPAFLFRREKLAPPVTTHCPMKRLLLLLPA